MHNNNDEKSTISVLFTTFSICSIFRSIKLYITILSSSAYIYVNHNTTYAHPIFAATYDMWRVQLGRAVQQAHVTVNTNILGCLRCWVMGWLRCWVMGCLRCWDDGMTKMLGWWDALDVGWWDHSDVGGWDALDVGWWDDSDVGWWDDSDVGMMGWLRCWDFGMP